MHVAFFYGNALMFGFATESIIQNRPCAFLLNTIVLVRSVNKNDIMYVALVAGDDDPTLRIARFPSQQGCVMARPEVSILIMNEGIMGGHMRAMFSLLMIEQAAFYNLGGMRVHWVAW